jgi:hypothetical protein
MRTFLRAVSALLLLALWAAGCTVKKTEPPAPTGPSELATSITLTATPDTLDARRRVAVADRDRRSATPAVSRCAGSSCALEIALNGVVQDFGRLSAKRITTGSDGRATVVYTAPDAIAGFTGQTLVSILVTPVGTNASTHLPRAVEIRLVPPGVITPPGPRVPDFAICPLRARGAAAGAVRCVRPRARSRADVVCVDVRRRALRQRPPGDSPVPGGGRRRGDADGDRRCGGTLLTSEDAAHRPWGAPEGRVHLLARGASGGTGRLLQRGRVDGRGRPPHRALRLGLRQRPVGGRRHYGPQVRHRRAPTP